VWTPGPASTTTASSSTGIGAPALRTPTPTSAFCRTRRPTWSSGPPDGFSAVTPAGAILGILTGTELTKLEVAIDVYDEKLDERIAQIKAECGL
jgi:hypothetical protein